MPTTNHQPSTTNLLTAWLTLCATLVVAMVFVGGYTRLSGSGLSITKWKPIHGVIPPQNEQEWVEEWELYKQTPQYSAINKGMSVEEFKAIFWPEFFHRLLGRVIGIVFLIPLVFFTLNKSLAPRFALRLLFIFALGGVQGFMGWYMVKSGLSNNIYVSHFRLAAHLSLALLLLGLLIWAILSSRAQPRDLATPQDPSTSLRVTYIAWFTLLCLQILYGAFMAGLHCGLIYNSYPSMNGEWLPSALWEPNFGPMNFFENCATVQFIHRTLPILLVLGFVSWWFFNRAYVKDKKLSKIAFAIALVLALQFVLGVLTLVNVVPLGLGLIHQMMAILLFGLGVVLLHRVKYGD